MANRRRSEREHPSPARRHRAFGDASGLGVDAHGSPVIDPTENVRELFDAGATRQDDLRLAERRLQEEKIVRIESSLSGVKREVKLRARHQKDIDALEAKRLDAIRAVDQLTAKTEADRQAAAVTTLATQAATTAETLRSAVNTSATNLATQLDRTVTAITERIAALEKSSYTGAGKQAVADPIMEQMVNEIRKMSERAASHDGRDPAITASLQTLAAAQSALLARVESNTARIIQDGGKATGSTDTVKMLIAGVGLLATLMTIIGAIVGVALFMNGQQKEPPQVIYAPAPPGSLLPTTPPSAVPR